MTENKEVVTHEQENYQSRPVTMGTLQMWVPILMTSVGIVFAVVSAVVSFSVQNANRLATLETLVQVQGDTLNRLQSSVSSNNKDIQDIYRRLPPTYEASEGRNGTGNSNR